MANIKDNMVWGFFSNILVRREGKIQYCINFLFDVKKNIANLTKIQTIKLPQEGNI